jgi:hypothetical protein
VYFIKGDNMKHKLLSALALTALFSTPARADFLGLAPGDYTIALQDAGWVSGARGLLDNLTGTIHIPSDPVTVASFNWTFALRDSIGPVAFNWTGKTLQVYEGEYDGIEVSWAREVANGPARVCDIATYCYPDIQFIYDPARSNGLPCDQGGCPQYWVDAYGYLNNTFGGWSAHAIPEPYSLFILGFGLIILAWRIRAWR